MGRVSYETQCHADKITSDMKGMRMNLNIHYRMTLNGTLNKEDECT